MELQFREQRGCQWPYGITLGYLPQVNTPHLNPASYKTAGQLSFQSCHPNNCVGALQELVSCC